MGPRQEEEKKAPQPRPEEKKRFRLIRLEERIAPKFTHKTCTWTL